MAKKPKYQIQEIPIEGMKVITPEVEGDSRNFLSDLDTQDEFSLMALDEEFVQQNVEKLPRGVLRGLHFQRENSQGTLLAVTSGRALCVGTDLRPESKSFGASHAVELTVENERLFYIPPYFAHGFLTLEPNTEVVMLYTQEYDAAQVSTMIWDDEILAIDWQFERFEIDAKRLNISQRDKKAPSFRSYNQNSLWINRPKKSKYAIGY